jgi:hypothetical protein
MKHLFLFSLTVFVFGWNLNLYAQDSDEIVDPGFQSDIEQVPNPPSYDSPTWSSDKLVDDLSIQQGEVEFENMPPVETQPMPAFENNTPPVNEDPTDLN